MSKPRSRRRLVLTPGGILRQVIMLAMVFAVLYPVYFMTVSAFKLKIEYVNNKLGLPIQPVLTNFVEAFRGKTFLIWFRNSTMLTLAAVVASVFLACLAAYAFSHMRFRGKEGFFNVIIALMVIPPVVMVIPLFSTMTRLGLVNTYASAIIVYSGLLLPFSIYLLRNFFITVPMGIVESAKIDGASEWQVLWLILIPLSRPALVALVLVNALYVWNELLIALIFLQTEQLKTLMVGLSTMQGRFQLNQPLIMAGMLIACLPMLLLYLFGQGYFIKGLAAGALKGE